MSDDANHFVLNGHEVILVHELLSSKKKFVNSQDHVKIQLFFQKVGKTLIRNYFLKIKILANVYVVHLYKQ